MSYNLSQIMKSAHRNYKKGGKTFSECLKSAWSFAKLQESFSPEAVKSRTDKFLAERHEAMSKTAKLHLARNIITLIFPLPLTTTQIVLITVHITSEINQIIQQWIKEPN